MKTILRGLAAAGLASTALLFTGPAVAQQEQQQVSPYVQAVIDQLSALVPAMAQQGYPNYEVLQLNAINNGVTEPFNYANADAQDVVFIAVCDTDCSNIDLRVKNGGRVVGEDVLDDKLPVVQTAESARPLNVDVIMTTCSQNPCVYGLAVFRR
ncbi:MAG TPA: hypothetical protein PLK37_06090 [Terricaulis sp.]|nr:hypothetical protein [Terricaulis sp.]